MFSPFSMFYYSLTVIWPQMINSLYSTDQIMIGLMSGTVGGSIAFGQVFGGATIRFGWGHWQLRGAAVLMCVFIGGMAAANASTRTLAIVFCCLGSFAVGIVEVIGIVAVPFTVPPGDLGLASGLLGSMRSTLGSVALAIFTSILSSEKKTQIPSRLNPLAEQDSLPASSITALLTAGMSGAVATIASIPGIPADRVATYIKAIQEGNVASYRVVFFSSLAFGIFALACAFFTKNFSNHFTNDVSRRLQGTGKMQNEKKDVESVK